MSAQTKRVLSLVGSGVVILSFFLPWDRWFSGLGYFLRTFRAYAVTNQSAEVVLWLFVGWAVILTPLVCHAISVMAVLSRRIVSRTLAIIPAGVWLISLLLGSARVGRYFDIVSDFAGIGSVGTLLGIAFTTVVAFLKTVPSSPPLQRAAWPQATSLFCPACGRQLSIGSRFCANCGTQTTGPLQTPLSTPIPATCSCGAQLEPDSNFCSVCGKRVS